MPQPPEQASEALAVKMGRMRIGLWSLCWWWTRCSATHFRTGPSIRHGPKDAEYEAMAVGAKRPMSKETVEPDGDPKTADDVHHQESREVAPSERDSPQQGNPSDKARRRKDDREQDYDTHPKRRSDG